MLASAMSLLSVSHAYGQSKIIVDKAGNAGIAETITITSYTGVKPNKVFTTDTIKFTPAAADVATTTTKAMLVATSITAQSAKATAASANNIVTVTPAAGTMFSGIFFFPGKSKEVMRLNPGVAFGDPPPIEFSFTLDGSYTSGSYNPAELVLSSYTFDDPTAGKSAATVLTDFASDINSSTPYLATISGDELLIDNATINDAFSAFVDDPGFTYSYGEAAVPEPASLALLGGLSFTLLARRRRRI